MREYWAHYRIAAKQDMHYFVSDSLVSGIGFMTHVGVTLLLYSAIGSTLFFGRFTWAMLGWYLIITQLLMMNQADVIKTVNSQIQSGEIVSRMNKPFHYPIALLAMHLGGVSVSVFALLLFAIPFGLLIGGTSAITLWGVLAGVAAAALAFVVDFFLSLSIGLIAFWTENSSPYFWIYSKMLFLLGGLLFPLDLLPDAVRAIAEVLPPAFMLYYPARLFVDFSPELFVRTLVGQSLYLLLAGSLAFLIYRSALRKVNVNGG